MIRIPLMAALAVIFLVAPVNGTEPRVFTDRDLENIKQAPIMDDESAGRQEAELKAYEQRREAEPRQRSTGEEQRNADKETRAVWGNMKKALTGNQDTGR